jgi:hypothetical protein
MYRRVCLFILYLFFSYSLQATYEEFSAYTKSPKAERVLVAQGGHENCVFFLLTFEDEQGNGQASVSIIQVNNMFYDFGKEDITVLSLLENGFEVALKNGRRFLLEDQGCHIFNMSELSVEEDDEEME